MRWRLQILDDVRCSLIIMYFRRRSDKIMRIFRYSFFYSVNTVLYTGTGVGNDNRLMVITRSKVMISWICLVSLTSRVMKWEGMKNDLWFHHYLQDFSSRRLGNGAKNGQHGLYNTVIMINGSYSVLGVPRVSFASVVWKGILPLKLSAVQCKQDLKICRSWE